jgi:DNA-directed RNA polymerase specialized sigma24 family protein
MDLDVHLPAIRARDADAFADWMAGAELPLRRSLSTFAAAVDVEAVLQEALLRVWQVADRVWPDGRPNALLRFATRVARNAALDEVRRLRTVPVEAPEPEPVEPALPDPALRERLERCRAALAGPARAAFEARLAGAGAPDAVLAEQTSMQLNTFLKNVGRARTFLEECLRRAGVVLAEVWR